MLSAYRIFRLQVYIAGQHRLGRPLIDILEDARVEQLGGTSLRGRVLEDPRTIALIEQDVARAIAEAMRTLAKAS